MIDIKHGDCLEIMKKIQDNSIDLIITDPPYLMNYKSNHRKDKKHDFCTVIVNDDNFDLIEKYIKECFRIAKNNTALYMFCNSNHIDYFKQQIEDVGYNVKNIIVWVKNNWTAGDLQAQYGKQYEFIIYANIIIDLFGGSGTTLIACEQMNRTCYMMEFDPQYVDVIIDRWEQFTGKKAVLIDE